MQGGQAALKIRQADEKDEQIMRLKAKIGDLTMSNELLEQKIDRMENGFPLPRGRSKR
jgi:cell division protein FtsB